MDKAPKFTFKNYLKELKKSWILLLIFFILGTGAGIFYAFKNKTVAAPQEYMFEIAVHNSKINNNTEVSPYDTIGGLLYSKKLLLDADKDIKEEDIPGYSVSEPRRGIFDIKIQSSSYEKAEALYKGIIKNATKIIGTVYSDAEDYKIVTLKEINKPIDDSAAGGNTKKRILSIAIAAFGALALGMLLIFIRFDFTAAK